MIQYKDMFLDISTISYLPEPIKTKIKKYQKQFSKKFKTVQALDWVPHLTIADRVLIPKNKFDHICQQLKTICYKTKQLKVTSKNLGFTTQTTSVSQKHYVIFIKIEVTQELQKLHDLIQRKIYQGLKRPSYESNKYAPHITLAYKDLTKENFNKAKKFLKKYPLKTNYSFILDNIQLVASLNNNRKRSIKKFRLKK